MTERRVGCWGTVLAWAALVGCPIQAGAQTFNLLVEPNYPPERAAEVYRPLVEYLNAATGFDFQLVTSRNYHFYWADIRRENDFDFIFDEAHFTDFRIQRFGFIPLVRTYENTQYSLLALDYDEDDEDGLIQLVGRNIVTMPAPSLGAAMLVRLFPNPMQQPEIRSAASSWRDTVEIIFSGEADAAMVPVWLEEQYPNLISIVRSEEFAGPAISAAPSVPSEAQAAVREALLRLHEDPALFEILQELAISRFVPASAADYEGASTVLSGFFGY